MTPDDLTRWEQLCNAASEGPWYMDVAIANDGHVVMSSPLGYRIAHYYHTDVNRNDAADAEFGAAAREAMPQLIAEVRRLQKMVGFSKTREHRSRCPGIEAWDVPGACSCDEPEVVRCKMCGARQRKDTPLEVNE